MELSNDAGRITAAKIILDTNMLTAILGLKIDVFSEIERMLGKVDFFIAEQTIVELNRIAIKGGKEGKKAKIALKILGERKYGKIVVPEKECDDALLEMSGTGMIIATNDRELRRRIRKNNGKTIFIRQKKFVELEG